MHKIWIVFWIFLGMMMACQMSGIDYMDEKINWSLELARTYISDTYSKGPPKVFSGQELLNLLPSNWNSFTIKEEAGQTFKGDQFHFSEAYRVFEDRESYLDIRLADYAADSSAWLNILSRYLDVENGIEGQHQLSVPPNIKRVFAWTWTDPFTGSSHLETGAHFRFHLNLRTNLPEGRKVLETIFQQFDWQALSRNMEK